MARTTPGVTRQRLLEAAIHLFATNGYDATSTADIQRACGLTASSGALYKHFPAKRALLEEAVRHNLETTAERSREAVAVEPGDLREALYALARVTWQVIEDDRDLIRIMLREFDNFPELFTRMWRGVLANVYGGGADWITTQAGRGVVRAEDPEATAAVLLASLTYYPILRAMTGHTPGDLAPERFLGAWVDHAVDTLQPRVRS
jgi:AcrR family transcriptional regulator